MRRKAAIVYCDEAGSTGADHFSPQQPSHTSAFLIIRASVLPRLTRTVEDVVADAAMGDMPELKGAKLLRTGRGQNLVGALGEVVLRFGGRLVVGFAEKRFHVCVLCVETYLDAEYNDHAPPQTARLARRSIAEMLYEWLDDALLKEFLGAVLADDVAALAAVGERIAGRLELHPSRDAPDVGRRIRHGVTTVFRFSEKHNGAPSGLTRPGPTLGLFYPCLAGVDRCVTADRMRAFLVADRDRAYGTALSFVLKTIEGGRLAALFERLNGPPGLASISGRREADSRDHLGLQLADVSAAVINSVLSAGITNPEAGVDAPRFALPFLQLARRNPNAQYYMVSRQFEARVGALLVGA